MTTKYFTIHDGVLKKKIVESKHLLHKEGDVPAIDKVSYDRYYFMFHRIEITTDKRVFECDKDTFGKYRKVIDYGYGAQYVMPRQHWNIQDKQKTLFDGN